MLKLDFEAQGRGSTFTLCHGHLKKGILSHKRATVQFHLNTVVYEMRFHELEALDMDVYFNYYL